MMVNGQWLMKGDAGNLPYPIHIVEARWGFAQMVVLTTAVELKVFTRIANGCKTAEQIAQAADCDLRGMRILLNALVALQVLKKQPDGSYALTPESEAYLVEGKPTFLGAMMERSERLLQSWMKLPECVRTGKPVAPVNTREHGAEFFRVFVPALMPLHYPPALAAAEALGIGATWKGVRAIDIAAGSGIWGIGVALKDPTAHVVAVDWEEVLEVTKQCVDKFGVSTQFSYLPGDIRQLDFGKEQYDLALLGHICHSEGENFTKHLLAKVFSALKPGGKAVIADYVPNDDRTGPLMPLIFAVNMLIFTQEGDTFTFSEYERWLKEAGFTEVTLIEAPAVSPLIVARKP